VIGVGKDWPFSGLLRRKPRRGPKRRCIKEGRIKNVRITLKGGGEGERERECVCVCVCECGILIAVIHSAHFRLVSVRKEIILAACFPS
jgi:hypothetical protein